MEKLNEMLNSATEEGRIGLITFARYLKSYSLDSGNLPVYLKLFKHPDSGIADILFKEERPISFFSIVPSSPELLRGALDLLRDYSIYETDPRFLFAVFGALRKIMPEIPTDGPKFSFALQDTYHIGKFLMLNTSGLSDFILDLLDDIGEMWAKHNKMASLTAQKIIDSWYDSGKGLAKIIPPSILNA